VAEISPPLGEDDGKPISVLKFSMVEILQPSCTSCYEEDLSDKEKAEIIAEDVAEFLHDIFDDKIILHDIFDDKIIMWGSNEGGGGFIARDEQQNQKSQSKIHQMWLWSGPLSQ
jgi:predicted RNA-binding protein